MTNRLKNQIVAGSQKQPLLTGASDLSVIDHAAEEAYAALRRLRKHRRFFEKDPEQNLSRLTVAAERGRTLRFSVRVFDPNEKRTRLLMDLSRWPLWTADPKLALKRAMTGATANERKQMLLQIRKPIKAVTIELKLSGVSTLKRNPYITAYRNADRQRRIKKKNPLLLWKPIFLPSDGHESKEVIDYIRWHLLLYLMQEGMLDQDEGVETFSSLLGRVFKVKKDLRSEVAKEVFTRFSFSEDWRAPLSYARGIVKQLRFSDHSRLESFVPNLTEVEEEEERHERGIVSRGRHTAPRLAEIPNAKNIQLFNVDEAVSYLRDQGDQISRDRVYDWVQKGHVKRAPKGDVRRYLAEQHIPQSPDRLEQIWLGEDSIQILKDELSAQAKKDALKKLLVMKGKSPEAARKYIYRHMKGEQSIEDIARRAMANDVEGRV